MADIDSKELTLVKTQASKALTAATDLIIKSDEDMVKATDLLSKIKQVGKLIKERKEAITKPLMEALSSARDLFKPIEQNHAEAESVIKGKMLGYQREVAAAAEAERIRIAGRVDRGTMKAETAVAKMEAIEDVKTSVQGKHGAIATRTIKKYRVTDESLLPREYLMPNMPKITEALKKGLAVPGAEMYTEDVIASSSVLSADSPLLGKK